MYCTGGMPEALCTDGLDNDGDGYTDCEDADCYFAWACLEYSCNDSIDNNSDIW